MTTRPALHRWILAVALVPGVVAGCFRLSRDTPRIRYYVLGGSPAAPAVAPAADEARDGDAARRTGSGVALGLRRVDLASYLAGPSIVIRRGEHEVLLSDFHRWGEELGAGINRVVAAQLAGSPGVRAVDVAPWAVRARHDFLVQLHIARFEGAAGDGASEGRSHLVAGWDIVRPVDGRVLVRGRSEALEGRWLLSDYAGLVKGLDAALARLALDITSCLSRFPNDSTPPARC